ncbi:MAG: bifunctional DNA-formamidopyrimidine glycosylase/DNA-(apurinic or apyrimidinic site) lyase [Candidatus Moranbacteria bacterium]|nr:bifunctional DNA-formamidopyrimidine glycosylase/DNA-(apurinic or apyrimidinic site) lyase [Candidatus Moranbacteria bacterium]
MPELPEVTTTVLGLQGVLPGLRFIDVWTDLAKKNQTIKQFKGTIKDEKFFKSFEEEVVGKKVLSVERRAKNILIHISGGHTILIHLKMTGHLLYGDYKKKVAGKKIIWEPKKKDSPLGDPYNRFIHFVFSLSNGRKLAFCDSRKFGKITMFKTSELEKNFHLNKLGPEPLGESMTKVVFEERLKMKPKGNIKTVLMDQSIVAGIGNIYSDEILWLSDVHPESKVYKIPKEKISMMYKNMQQILKKGIDFGGDSMSDYRNIEGLRGNFQHHHNVYRLSGSLCKKKSCKGDIIRKVVNGRSAHFCNKHQILFK